jgi:hypothetical protein
VVINDAALHLLCASAHYGDEDAVRVRAVLPCEADSKAIGHVLAQGVGIWTTAGVIPPEPSLQMKARVCVPMRWRGELLGLLMVMDEDGTLTAIELTGIAEVARTVAPLLLPQVRDDQNPQLVLDLLGRNPVLRRQALTELGAAAFEPLTAVEVAVPGAADEPVVARAATALRAAITAGASARPGRRLHAITGATAVLLLGDRTGLRLYVDDLLGRARDFVVHASRPFSEVLIGPAGRLAPSRGSCRTGVGAA